MKIVILMLQVVIVFLPNFTISMNPLYREARILYQRAYSKAKILEKNGGVPRSAGRPKQEPPEVPKEKKKPGRPRKVFD